MHYIPTCDIQCSPRFSTYFLSRKTRWILTIQPTNALYTNCRYPMLTPIFRYFLLSSSHSRKTGKIWQSSLKMQYIRIGDIQCSPQFSDIFFNQRVIQEKRGEIRQSSLQMHYIPIGDIQCSPRFSVIFFYQRVIQEKRGEIWQSSLQMDYIPIGDIQCSPRFPVIFFYHRVIQENRYAKAYMCLVRASCLHVLQIFLWHTVVTSFDLSQS